METYTLATPKPATPPPPPSGIEPQAGKKLPKAVMLGAILFGFLLCFLLGVFISGGTKKNTQDPAPVTPTEPPTVTPKAKTSISPAVNTNMLYVPGKPYYDDTITVITKKEPYIVLSAGVSRFGQNTGYTQYTKVAYFTGTTWLRENVTATTARVDITTNPLVRKWSSPLPLTGNLARTNGVDVTIENQQANFSFTRLHTDISAQARPGFTKFNYFGEGTLTVGNEPLEAYAVYTQTFAQDSLDISYLNTPEKVQSDWLVFWDQQGIAYHIDQVSSADRANPLQNYTLGSIDYMSGVTLKLVRASIQNAGSNGQRTAVLGTNPQTRIIFTVGNLLNKTDAKAFTWQTGIATGTVDLDGAKTNGVGVWEGIHRK